jgi:PAS domain S-box-containing protein
MRRITVGMVVFPGFQLLDIAGPKDAFAEVNVLSHGECKYDMLTVGTTGGTILSSSGLEVVPDCTISDPGPDIDTVIVAGGHGIFDAYDNPALAAWLGQQYQRARRVSSICNGVFALGSAGLIDNRVVTTHWMDVPRLAATFPKARIEPDNIYVKDGRIYTTAGVMAGIDLSLVMIEEDFGRKLALDVAKYLIINLRREGWQSQFSPMLECEIVLERQVEALMRNAIEHAGAERGLLILQRGPEQRIRAEATVHGDTVSVKLPDAPPGPADLPELVLHHVARTQERVTLDDAAADNRFSADPYLRERQTRSILCEPLLTQSKLIGVLYLEKTQTSGAFAPARVAMLKILASQAAIALENARLIRDLGEREARVRRLVDANIIGIFIWEREGRIIEANEAFLHIVGYEREDLASAHVDRTVLTPPEWRDTDARTAAELSVLGTVQPFEMEYLRKDGNRVPVLIGLAAFEEQRACGVAFVLDLTGRKRAEEGARENERRYREVQTELEHANRLATMGQLTASIAHDVKQPITAVATYASAALRWLGARPANLDEIRQALDGIVYEATRAGSIVSGIRNLVRKTPPRKDNVDINEAVREVIELTRGEAAKHEVSVRTVLGDALPLVLGDRVQLQQVMLNLVINAIESMGATGTGPRELLISTATDSSNGVSIAVRDSGPGLPPGESTRVFAPFYTTKESGLGMGLSICRSIVETHGGWLWACTNEPRGAVFQFTLPAGRDGVEVGSASYGA